MNRWYRLSIIGLSLVLCGFILYLSPLLHITTEEGFQPATHNRNVLYQHNNKHRPSLDDKLPLDRQEIKDAVQAPPVPRPLNQPVQCAASHFPTLNQFQPSQSRSILSNIHELGQPATYIFWAEERVRCPVHYPLMNPPFLRVCSSNRDPYRSLNLPGPHGKPGFHQLCSMMEDIPTGDTDGEKIRIANEGAGMIMMVDGFVGPMHGYPYNLTHDIRMNPWYKHRSHIEHQSFAVHTDLICYDSVAIIHSVYDDVVGPHPVLEVAPLIALLLDTLPAHIPIITTLNDRLTDMYHTLNIDTTRLVAYDPVKVYHAHHLYWMRRPEEFSPYYYSSVRSRLSLIYGTPSMYKDNKPTIILIERIKNNHRKIINFEELYMAILQLLPSSEYNIIRFDGRIPMKEAIQLFSHASIIIGAHGGAFLNTLFMPLSAVIIEIAYPSITEMPFPPYYYLSTCGLGLYHWIVFADLGSYTNTMHVNIPDILHIMQQAWMYREKDISNTTHNLVSLLGTMTIELHTGPNDIIRQE